MFQCYSKQGLKPGSEKSFFLLPKSTFKLWRQTFEDWNSWITSYVSCWTLKRVSLLAPLRVSGTWMLNINWRLNSLAESAAGLKLLLPALLVRLWGLFLPFCTYCFITQKAHFADRGRKEGAFPQSMTRKGEYLTGTAFVQPNSNLALNQIDSNSICIKCSRQPGIVVSFWNLEKVWFDWRTSLQI